MAYEHIQKELEKQGKTQTEMARVLGRTHAIATSIFNGSRRLHAEEIPVLAKWLRKPDSFILYGVDDNTGAQYTSRLDACRVQLDTAIKLWFENEAAPAVHTLAIQAYKIIYGDEAKEEAQSEKSEWIILSVITELQLHDEKLTKPEVAFLLWLSASDSTLSKNQGRVLSSQFIQAKNRTNSGEPDKLAFFRNFTREGNIKGE